MPAEPFPPPDIAAVYRAIRERRDMRHFSGGQLAPGQLMRLLEAAHMGPSVGFMQPWRFLRIGQRALRERIHAHVEQERLRTAEALEQRGDAFMQIKVEGILACAELIVVGLSDLREPYIFGRRTMPQMDLASAACAIQNLWLAARAEGIGMGWVSLFDPVVLRELCGMPPGSDPIAILCLGPVDAFYPAPMLETEGWDSRRKLQDLVYQDRWGDAPR